MGDLPPLFHSRIAEDPFVPFQFRHRVELSLTDLSLPLLPDLFFSRFNRQTFSGR